VPEFLLKSETLVVRPLIEFTPVPIASNDYLRVAGMPTIAADLGKLAYLGRAGEARGYTVTFTGDTTEEVLLTPVFTANNALILRKMALAGVGFALIPLVLVNDDIKAGTLVQLLKNTTVSGGNVRTCLAYPSRKHISTKLRTFIDHILTTFENGLPPQPN